jgi:hypothetical protein
VCQVLFVTSCSSRAALQSRWEADPVVACPALHAVFEMCSHPQAHNCCAQHTLILAGAVRGNTITRQQYSCPLSSSTAASRATLERSSQHLPQLAHIAAASFTTTTPPPHIPPMIQT